MVEEEDKGWRALLEKQELHQAADILEKYGIGSATEVSDLEKDDFSELEARGLKPLQLKKLKRWCEAGRSACATEMLPSSSTFPPPALTSSVALTVSDEESVTESESDDSEAQESGEHESDKDCEVIGGKETAIAHWRGGWQHKR
jgi:hypothetical protein